MKKVYTIKKVDANQAISQNIWGSIPSLDIDVYPWNENGYMPKSNVKVFYTNSHFHVKFSAFENEIRSEYKNWNEPVYQDSCVEFFFNPCPEKDNRYLNFEVNAIGTMLLGLGQDRSNRMSITEEEDFRSFSIKTSVKPEEIAGYRADCWSVEYAIPFRFLEKVYGTTLFNSGKKMYGNFYKCGDCTKNPHYGCWNEIINPNPDFHRPEFFGILVLE